MDRVRIGDIHSVFVWMRYILQTLFTEEGMNQLIMLLYVGKQTTRQAFLFKMDARFSFFIFLCLSSQSYGDVSIAGEGLQILTYARHSWPLSSEGSLTCHTHCDTGLPFILVISEDPWQSHLLPSVWQCSYHYLFLRVRSVAIGDPDLPHARRTLYLYATAAV